MNPFTFLDSWWERWRVTRPQLALADKTWDQSHTWHALISAIAGVLAWAVLGWWLGTRAWAYGVLAAIAVYVVRELVWRVVYRIQRWRRVMIRWQKMRWWDALLDVGKPLWAPGILALAVIFGDVPTWIVALFAALTLAIAYAYTFGRPRGALFYDGTY